MVTFLFVKDAKRLYFGIIFQKFQQMNSMKDAKRWTKGGLTIIKVFFSCCDKGDKMIGKHLENIQRWKPPISHTIFPVGNDTDIFAERCVSAYLFNLY